MTTEPTPDAEGGEPIWILTAHADTGGYTKLMAVYHDKRTAYADFVSRAGKRGWFIKPWRDGAGLRGEALTEDCWYDLHAATPGSFPDDIDASMDPEELVRAYIAARPAPSWMS
ncbi:hypothetical protein [Nocardia brasiliensis]|uniref:hypothetical protein n=1 Tax=Nocardia brasiliensis TaxID=37326 RepID=UPI002457B248|nr:hypothetical protein [Nocardia brasiliensis]